MSTHPALVRTLLLLLAGLLISPVQAATTTAPAPGRQLRLGGPGPSYTSDRPGTRAIAERWIVQLKTPPLAQAPDAPPSFAAASVRSATTGRLLADSPAARRYRQQLQQQQAEVFAALQRAFPRAQMQRSYQILFDGLAVVLPGADATAIDRLRQMPEVAEVYPDRRYELDLFSSLQTIGADALWQSPAIGGASNAGAGVKIAVIDSGIKIDNPFFNPAGFSYPAGFPKGDTAHTTPKVIAARAYFRPDLPPLPGEETPQPGPGASSHGTHVAGIAAGVANTQATVNGLTETIAGVAPRAYLMNYKVFYENDSIFSGSGFSVELMAALEDAVADGADVINNSWGGRAESDPRFDVLAVAASAAVDAGVAVIYSAGNEGPDPSTAGSPGFAEKVITVGATTTDETIAFDFLDVTGPGEVPGELKEHPFSPAAFGATLTAPLTAPYVPVAAIGGSSLACDPLQPGALAGKVALIERGVCAFSIKVYNAQSAGAIAAIVYNSEAGGDELITMAPDQFADDVTIPAVFVGRSIGTAMVDWYARSGPAAEVRLDPSGRVQELPADVIVGFSSRGPTFQGTLKPDVVAPGYNILSAGFAEAEGAERHTGFGLVSGTSMAAPHVAGGAALLRQIHPNWSPLDIKSALMSTATTEVWLDLETTEPAGARG
jgi:subtilisin family serine protease